MSYLQVESQVWYAAALLTALASIFNFIVVGLSKSPIAKTLKRVYLLYAFAFILWSANVFIFSSTKNNQVSYVSCVLLHMGAIFIPIFLLHFVICFFEIKSYFAKTHLYTGYILASFFAALLFFHSNLYIEVIKPERLFNQFFDPGPVYIYWVVAFSYYVIISHLLVIQAYSKKRGEEKRRIAYFVFPSFVAYAGCAAYFMPVYDLFFFPYPWSCFGSTILSSVMLYAVLRHKLLGIDLIFKRTLVYASLFCIVYGAMTIMSLIGVAFFETLLGWPRWTASIPTALALILCVRPLESYLTKVTEKYLFQKPYDYKELLRMFTTEVLTVLDLEKVAHNTAHGLSNIIKLERCAVVLKTDAPKGYNIMSQVGYGDDYESEIFKKEYLSLIQSSGVIQNEGCLLVDDRDLNTKNYGLKDAMNALCCEVVVPIHFLKNVIGFIFMGGKKSGDSFTKEDIDIFLTLAKTTGIAIQNARLYQELSETQAEAAQSEKMAVVGTLASGINHEICNPLGIVRGHCEVFLLNLKDGLYKDIDKDKLLAMIEKMNTKIIEQIDRATGITKRLSAFAKPNKMFKREPVNASHEVDEVLQILAHEMRIHNIKVKNELPQDFPQILVDKKQIQEVVFNIIRNAAQAMNGAGTIDISGARNGVRAWIDIADTGPGISEEKMKKIFNPFFTTKSPGEGTGLGLYIVKQIVEKNKGQISIESKEGEGATFRLNFEIADDANRTSEELSALS